jgi:plasmid stability protein
MAKDPLFKLRLPDDLRAPLAVQAKANRRSVTGEILAILDQALRGPRKEPAAEEASRA